MAALDGKITIERELRSCMVKIPKRVKKHIAKPANTITGEMTLYTEESEREIKTLFHCWHPVTGNAIVEYEDGTIHEVEPQNIRFVDNVMCEYAFPDKSKDVEKQEDADWHCPNCKDGIMRIDDSMVLTSNPPQYQYKCDKCGHVEYSNQVNRTMTQTTLWSGKQHRPAETWKPYTQER